MAVPLGSNVEDIEACDVSLKDITPLELPGNEQNDLCNITNDETIDNDNNMNTTGIYKDTILLGTGDAPPSNARLGEVKLKDLEASLHKHLSCLF